MGFFSVSFHLVGLFRGRVVGGRDGCAWSGRRWREKEDWDDQDEVPGSRRHMLAGVEGTVTLTADVDSYQRPDLLLACRDHGSSLRVG